MKAPRALLATGAMMALLVGTALAAASDDGLSALSADELDQLNTMIDGPPIPAAPEVLARDDNGRATLRAVRLDEPLAVDGSLDERIYATVPAMSGFVQQEPLAGEQATEQTDVWVFYDATSVYIAARLWDSHPERIVANEMRRDNRNIPEPERELLGHPRHLLRPSQRFSLPHHAARCALGWPGYGRAQRQ